MSARIAALPMYDFAGLRAAHDALWTALADALLLEKVRILCWTPRSPSLPFVTARATDEYALHAIRSALESVIEDSTLSAARERLFLDSVELRPDVRFARPLELERVASELAYSALA